MNVTLPPKATDVGRSAGVRGAWYAVVVIALVSFVSNIDRGIINLLVEPIKHDLALTDTSVSLLVGFAFSFFYMLCGLPMARVSDAHNRKIILTCALTVWSVATALCGLAQQFWQLFAARGLVGAGESVKGPCSMSMISDLVPRDRFPRAFAIYQLGINAGMGGALILGGFLLAVFAHVDPIDLGGGFVIKDWHLVFLVASAPGLLLALVMALTVKEPVRRGRTRKGQAPIGEVVRFVTSNWRIYLPLLLSIAIASIETFGMAVWRPTLFTRTYDLSLSISGTLVGTMMLVATPIGLGAGAMLAEYLIRRKHDDAMVRVCFYAHIMSVPLAILMPLMPTWWLCFGVGLLAAIAAGMAAPGQNSAIQIITPNEMRGQINAVYLFAISVIGGGFGPTAIALLTDYVFGNDEMLRYAMSLFVAIVGPIGILCAWLALKPYGVAARSAAEAETQQAATGASGIPKPSG